MEVWGIDPPPLGSTCAISTAQVRRMAGPKQNLSRTWLSDRIPTLSLSPSDFYANTLVRLYETNGAMLVASQATLALPVLCWTLCSYSFISFFRGYASKQSPVAKCLVDTPIRFSEISGPGVPIFTSYSQILTRFACEVVVIRSVHTYARLSKLCKPISALRKCC